MLKTRLSGQKRNPPRVLAFGNFPMKESNEVLLEEREELTLQNIRVISSGIADEGTTGALLRLCAILGVRSFHHIGDRNQFRLKDPKINQSAAGSNFRIPTYHHDSSNAATKIIESADKEYEYEFPARIYLVEGFTDLLYPPSDLIITPLIHQMYDVEGTASHTLQIGPKCVLIEFGRMSNPKIKMGRKKTYRHIMFTPKLTGLIQI